MCPSVPRPELRSNALRPLVFVQRQIGHRSISTTEEHCGQLEVHFMPEARTKAKMREAERLVPAAQVRLHPATRADGPAERDLSAPTRRP